VVEGTALSHLRSLLDVQVQLAQSQCDRETRARGKLVSALESLEPGAVEQLNRSGEVVDNLGIEALVEMFMRIWQAEILRIRKSASEIDHPFEDHSAQNQSQKFQALLNKANHLSEELDQARTDNQSLHQDLIEAQSEIRTLKDQLLVCHQTIAASVENTPVEIRKTTSPQAVQPATDEPDWMVGWRSRRGFEREALFLRLLGETGLGRAPSVFREVARQANVKGTPNSIRDIARRLLEAGLVEVDDFWSKGGSSSGGRLPVIIRLSARGREAYHLLTRKEALPCEMDVMRQKHQSYEHAHLIIETAEFLEKENYRVMLSAPTAAGLSTNGTFKPDLVAIDQKDSIHYIEVERDTHKNSERLPKWRNFHAATGGKLYIICDNRTCMRATRNEITDVLLRHTPGDLHITNLADLRAGKRGEDGSIWLEKRLRRNSGQPFSNGENPTL
jgi:hypothetical protein